MSKHSRRQRTRPKPLKNCFLSHSHYNKEFADKLADELARHGVELWYFPSPTRGLSQWYRDIGEALHRCDWFLIALSPSALRSVWVERELTFALDEARYNRAISPLLIRNCTWKRVPWLFALRGMQVIDFRKDFQAGLRGLFGLWGLERED